MNIEEKEELLKKFEKAAKKVGNSKRKFETDTFVASINRYLTTDQMFRIISDITEPEFKMPIREVPMLKYSLVPNPIDDESEQIRALAYHIYDHSKEIFGVDNYDTIQRRKL